jgi:hypothetical protein
MNESSTSYGIMQVLASQAVAALASQAVAALGLHQVMRDLTESYGQQPVDLGGGYVAIPR